MTITETLERITESAKEYSQNAIESIERNQHMNETRTADRNNLNQRMVDAILVDFINFLGAKYRVDYCLYTQDLNQPDKR